MKADILTNHFLVAMPSLKDENFSKSVVYIYEHSKDGALGMIINKPLQINLGNVLEHLNIATDETDDIVINHNVLMGGPVGQEHGFIIYRGDPAGPSNAEEIMVSASKEMLKDISTGVGPKDFLITLGYSGWDSGQLEHEIARNDWLIAKYHEEILFDAPLEKRWAAAAASIGVNVNQLSDQIGHA